MQKYYLIAKDNRNEFIFVGENQKRVKDLDEAKKFSDITIQEWGIPIATNTNDFGQLICGAKYPSKKYIAIPIEDTINILGKPKLVFYRVDV